MNRQFRNLEINFQAVLVVTFVLDSSMARQSGPAKIHRDSQHPQISQILPLLPGFLVCVICGICGYF